MAVITPPLFQTVDATYTGASLGLPYRDIVAEGVVASTDLAVSQRGAGANLSVDVAAGVVWVRGDDSSSQPTYRCVNDATVNLAISAADATNPRIDIVIAEVRDAAFSGVSTDWRLRVVTGTPAGSPSAPSTPNNAVKLANVSVPALDTTISNAQITDTRPRASVAGSLAPAYVTSLPATPYDGQDIYFAADATNGVIWHLRYRSAASGSYKWEFVGGPAMTARVDTDQSTTSGSFAALGTAGPSVTVPLAGDYIVAVRSNGYANGVATIQHSYDIGGTGAVTANAGQAAIAASGYSNMLNAENRHNGVTASTAFVSKYATTAGTANFRYRWMSVVPVRVG